MGLRAKIGMVVALWVGLTLIALPRSSAQDEAPKIEKEKPDERDEEPPGGMPPSTALPVEDPTSVPSGPPQFEKELGRGEPERVTQPEEEELQVEPAATGRTTGTAPIEDPTLDIAPPPEDEPPSEEGAVEAPEETPEETTNVKVVYDNRFLLSVDDWFFLSLSGLIQARYTVNYRNETPIDDVTGEPELNVVQGFDVPRARFTLGIGLTEFVALVMRIGVASGGNFSFQRAFIDLKWKNFRLRGGLFMNELIAEDLANPVDLQFLDYTIVENVFQPGSSKGVMMTYLRERFSINLGYSDGLRTGFSEIRSAANADFAVTMRAQYGWGKLGLGGFNRFNARRGTPFGIRLGGAFHYQNGGRTGLTLPLKIALGTIDLVVRGSGWSVFFAAVVGQDQLSETGTQGAQEILVSGVTLMGGYFVLENLQVFGQYSVVPKGRFQGVLPPDITDEPSSFHAIGFGLSYFVIPNFDMVKVSTDFQYFIGRTSGSLVPASPLNGIQPNDAGSQFAWRIQISAAF